MALSVDWLFSSSNRIDMSKVVHFEVAQPFEASSMQYEYVLFKLDATAGAWNAPGEHVRVSLNARP